MGAIAASDIIIKDTLPVGLSLVSQSSTTDLAFNGATTGELVWGPGTLNVNGSGTITVCAKVREIVPVGDPATHVVTISGSVDPDPTAPGNNVILDSLTFDTRTDRPLYPAHSQVGAIPSWWSHNGTERAWDRPTPALLLSKDLRISNRSDL